MLARTAAVSFLCGWCLAAATPETRPAEKSLFAQERVWSMHIRLSAEAWKQMQPRSRPRFLPRLESVNGAATKPTAEAEEGPVISPYGYIYNYADGVLEVEGEPATEMAVRFKGNYSYAFAQGPRKPMKIEFDRGRKGRSCLGARTLNLHISAGDASGLREPLAYWVFREAQVPAPRTSFARVSLTVEGVYNRRDLGTFVIVEQVDEAFLDRHFGNHAGMLLKPEMLRGIPYLGREWEKYCDRYGLKQATEASGRKFVQFVRLIHFADDATFARRLGEFIDEGAFLRFIAVQGMIVNLDSILTTGHNYYLYERPSDGRYVFVPWDMNMSFGGFGAVAGAEQQLDWSVRKPYVPPNRLIERILAVAELRDRYERLLKEIAAEVVNAEMLKRQIGRLNAQASAGVAANSLEAFVARRGQLIEEQLAGKREGYVAAKSGELWADDRRSSLAMSGMAALKQAGFVGKPVAEATANLRRSLEVLAGGKEWVSRDELMESLSDLLRVPEHYVFDPGLGMDWGTIVFRAADRDGDGRATLAELTAAVTAAATTADANADGKLTAAELQRAVASWTKRR